MRLYTNIILSDLRQRLSQYPQKKILFDAHGRSITSSELLNCIDIAATELVSRGLKKGDRALFLSRPSIESVIHFFAIIRAGGSVVLVDPEMGQENFMSRIAFSKPAWMFQDKILEQIETFSFIKPVLRAFHIWFPDQMPFDSDHRITVRKFDEIVSQNISAINEEQMPDDTEMLIIFTSGTVTDPKGVVHSYASMAAAMRIITNEISISKDDLLYASQFYFVLIALGVSAQAFIPGGKQFDPERFCAVGTKLKATSAFLLPYEGELVYTFCKRNNTFLPESFKTILFGSAPVTKGFLSRFSTICEPSLKAYGVYGSTEMLAISTVEMHEKINYTGEGDLVGKPAKGVQITIAEDKEILASGPQLFVNYLGDSEPAKVFHSGDLGDLDKDGNVVLLGRKKDMIIRKGYNVYPSLFEAGISKIPGVVECAMVGIYDDSKEDEKIVLFVVSNSREHSFVDSLKASLKAGSNSIDAYAYPDKIMIVPAMPRSGRSKKIDKKALRDLASKTL
jgi:long-chain acyl-CoA synthetase